MQNMVRIKPAKPSSGLSVSLHWADRIPRFVPLNLFFKPSSSGPTELRDFAASLQDVVDRLPFVAGSIYTVERAHGVKSKELVDDGRGVDLVWNDSLIPYIDLPESVSLMPRDTLRDLDSASSDETILMVKFTKVSCSFLSMLAKVWAYE